MKVIFNADDFGLTPGVNKGMLKPINKEWFVQPL